MMDRQQAVNLIKKLTSYTKYYGVVNIEGVQQGITRFANSQISQNTNKSDLSVSLTLYDGKKEATCTSNVLDDDALKRLAKDTEDLLSCVPKGEHDIFEWRRQPVKIAENDKDLPVFYNASGRADTIKQGISTMGDGLVASGALVLEKKIVVYGNSTNTEDEILFTNLDNVQFNTVVTSTTDSAAGGGETISHRFGGLNIAGAFEQAKQRAVMSANPINLSGGDYTVILTPEAVCDLVSYITWSLNAKRVHDGLSFCDGNLPQTTSMGGNITIFDDVNDSRVFPLCFDYEGNQRRTVQLVRHGVVKNLLFDNKTAHLMGARPTGHAVSNKGSGGYSLHTVMVGGDSSIEEMIKNTERGILVSEFHYTNFVDPAFMQVTGLTRNGTFLIEKGNITRAVDTMRFNQNLVQALDNVSALSKKLSTVNAGGWACVMPAIAIERFNFS